MVYKNLTLRITFAFLMLVIYLISLSNAYVFISLVSIIYFIIIIEVLKFFKNFLFFILIYISISFLSFYYSWLNHYNIALFNLVIFTIILFDSYSFFIGKYFGKNFIFKNLSPKKTLEGYIGGFLLTNLSYLMFLLFINDFTITFTEIILLNLIIISASTGDLIQSFFKRKNNLKDSSNFLPGHGGFFDRFDSIILSIIILFFYNYLFI